MLINYMALSASSTHCCAIMEKRKRLLKKKKDEGLQEGEGGATGWEVKGWKERIQTEGSGAGLIIVLRKKEEKKQHCKMESGKSERDKLYL